MTKRRRSDAQHPRSGGPSRNSTSVLARELNLGPVSSGWMEEIGVRSLTDVRRIGSIEICRILKMRGRSVSLNLAYALEGALLGVHWTKVPPDVKAELQRALGKGRP